MRDRNRYTGLVLRALIGTTLLGHAAVAGAERISLESLQARIIKLEGDMAAAQTTITQQAAALSSLQAQLTPLADKLVHFSRSGTEVYITGANLNIRNGTGHSYNNINGLGNLIVGYNEARTGTGAVNDRRGSHNVILGFNQNYNKAGAFMSGASNDSTNFYASVIGGTGNVSGGLYSVVVGGYDNQATGNWSTVLGGQGVRATSQLAHVP